MYSNSKALIKPNSPPFRIELIDALITARLEIGAMPNSVTKNSRLEAISNTLWVKGSKKSSILSSIPIFSNFETRLLHPYLLSLHMLLKISIF